MDLILYHGHCPDGWCAAFIASKRYPEAQLIPLDHGATNPPPIVKDLDVLMVDFSLRTREENDALAAAAKSFRILDHHKTAQAVLEGAPYAVFDMKRSGAGLAWDYLFGKDSQLLQSSPLVYKPEYVHDQSVWAITERPWYVNYVEDRDLWNWKFPSSREICAFLGTLPFTIEAWDELDGADIRSVKVAGDGALAHINHYVREAVKQAQTGILQGYRTAVLNVPYLNCSEVGNELAKTHEVSLTWFERGDGIVQFSLRSIGDIDVSAIAKVFGGGGHKNAAGFQLSLNEGRVLVDRIIGRAIAERAFGKDARSPGGCA